MSDTPDAPASLEDEIATLATLISQARELVASGHTIDLAGLSQRVGTFCASIADDPPDDVESVTQMIEALVSDLNLLAQEITAQHAGGPGGGTGGGTGGGNGS